jgi:hypothetical protein
MIKDEIKPRLFSAARFYKNPTLIEFAFQKFLDPYKNGFTYEMITDILTTNKDKED